MPWRGPAEPGEFPTLGYLVGDWIEANCVIPDGALRGHPYELTDEMWSHLVHVYRLRPDAAVHPKYPRQRDGLVYYGTQLRRPQKWGKDPLNAAKVCAHAFGPVQFDGWDAAGEPVGRPVSTPWIQIAATSEDQTDNTFRPIYRMVTEGPIADTPGLDPGVTTIKLPNGDGWIEPVTMTAKSRLGNPITYASFTETHLMTDRDGGRPMVRAMKRNLAGMGGTWSEVTNAWDPSQNSAAQTTAEAKAPGVYLDHRAPELQGLSPEEFADDDKVRERIVIKYGDSARVNGGWVDEGDIYESVRDEETGESEARRFYLDEVVVGNRDAVNATRWDALARPKDDPTLLAAMANGNPDAAALLADRELKPGERVVLGFDGSRVKDRTALIAVRIRDGRWFTLNVWSAWDYQTEQQKAMGNPGRIPEKDVKQALVDALDAYEVWHLIADPYRWQTVLDELSGQYPKNPAEKPVVVEFPTNVEHRFDAAILLFETAVRHGEGQFTHDGDAELRKHATNAAIAQGGRKAEREDEGGKSTHYVKIVKKRKGWVIDAFIAGILGTWGRGKAIEEGALIEPEPEPDPWTFTS